MKKGKFSPEEETKLLNHIKDFRTERCLSEEEIYQLMVAPQKNSKKKFWALIADCLPDRSIKQVKNFCQRRFNLHNYKGKWTP